MTRLHPITALKPAATLLTGLVVVLVMHSASNGEETDSDAESGTWGAYPTVSYQGGYSTYDIKALAETPANPGELSEIASELEFPLDCLLLGGDLGWRSGSGRYWIRGGVSFNLTDPGGSMVDRDWMAGTMVSYSESDVEMDLLSAYFETRYGLKKTKPAEWWLLGRMEYWESRYDVIGYSGWQDLNMDGNRTGYSGTGLVLQYEITYFTPQVGLGKRWTLGNRSYLDLTALGGILFTSDRDDHILRGRVSEADALGFSLGLQAEARLLTLGTGGTRLVADLLGGLSYYNATGDQTQTWYEDEGSNPAGTVVSGISYGVESLQYMIGLQGGVEF